MVWVIIATSCPSHPIPHKRDNCSPMSRLTIIRVFICFYDDSGLYPFKAHKIVASPFLIQFLINTSSELTPKPSLGPGSLFRKLGFVFAPSPPPIETIEVLECANLFSPSYFRFWCNVVVYGIACWPMATCWECQSTGNQNLNGDWPKHGHINKPHRFIIPNCSIPNTYIISSPLPMTVKVNVYSNRT